MGDGGSISSRVWYIPSPVIQGKAKFWKIPKNKVMLKIKVKMDCLAVLKICFIKFCSFHNLVLPFVCGIFRHFRILRKGYHDCVGVSTAKTCQNTIFGII